jgi:hypothetical protein
VTVVLRAATDDDDSSKPFFYRLPTTTSNLYLHEKRKRVFIFTMMINWGELILEAPIYPDEVM